jgi:mRNA interferase RelE/StbE
VSGSTQAETASENLGPVETMTYEIEFKPRAIKDLKSIPHPQRQRIVAAAEALHQDLDGDVKRLTNCTPEYRLRVGDYRVLFEVEGDKVVIYRVRHRKDAYK